jgi:hypothetical protein
MTPSKMLARMALTDSSWSIPSILNRVILFRKQEARVGIELCRNRDKIYTPAEKEKVMENFIFQQPQVEHVRKIIYSLYTVCIMDIERKVEAADLEQMPAWQFYHNDKVRHRRASYTIDLKV